MAHAELVTRPARGQYAITDRGRQVLLDHPDRIDMTVLNGFPEYRAFRATKRVKVGSESAAVVTDEVSPSEAIGALLADADEGVAADLLGRILAQPPAFLETHALRL